MINLIPLGRFISVPSCATQSDVEEYFDRIVDMSSICRQPGVRVTPSTLLLERLVETEEYPYFFSIKSMLTSCGVTHLSAEDINVIVNSIIQNSASLEDVSGIDDVLWKDATFAPSLTSLGEYHSESTRSVLLASLWKRFVAKSNQQFAVIIGSPDCCTLAVSATVEIVESNVLSLATPLLLDCDLNVCGIFKTLVSSIDPVLILMHATALDQVVFAVQLAVLKDIHESNGELCFDDVPAFDISKRFIDSLDDFSFRNSYGKTSKVLSCMADIILQKNQAKGHSIRVSEAGGAPPLKRGQDIAWRHDVDYDFHLHLWKRSGAGPEFVKLAVHSDVSI